MHIAYCTVYRCFSLMYFIFVQNNIYLSKYDLSIVEPMSLQTFLVLFILVSFSAM